MCGTLKLEHKSRVLGNMIAIVEDGQTNEARWVGFAKKERIGFWMWAGNAKPVIIKIDGFIEGKTEFKSKNLSGLKMYKDVTVNGKVIAKAGEVKILTRASVSVYEHQIHSRFPVTNTEEPYIFSRTDTIQLELPL